ncbi:MAG: LysR family transcriptional regulator [Pseudomonadota bacterium]
MINDLRPLAIFATVADKGSFRGAAKHLGLSPSVVSHHIGALEHRLGVALLYRSTRKLALTEDGERLLASARQMTAAAQQGLSSFAKIAESPVGTLKLSLPVALSAHPIVSLLADFSTRFSGVALNLEFSDVRRDLVASGLDLVLRMGEAERTAHSERPLCIEPKYLVAASGYVAERMHPTEPTDLDGWDLIGFSPRLSPVVLTKGHTDHPLTQTSRITVDNSLAILQLTLAGAGVSVLPASMVQADLDAGRLHRLLEDWSLPSLPIKAVWPKNSPRHGLTNRLVHFLVQGLVDTNVAAQA